MKKYLLGLFAIVIAVGLSAFTQGNGRSKGSRLVNSYGQWYYTTDFGTKIGERFYNGIPVPKTSVQSGCPDEEFPVCAVGSNFTLTEGADLPQPEGEYENYLLESE